MWKHYQSRHDTAQRVGWQYHPVCECRLHYIRFQCCVHRGFLTCKPIKIEEILIFMVMQLNAMSPFVSNLADLDEIFARKWSCKDFFIKNTKLWLCVHHPLIYDIVHHTWKHWPVFFDNYAFFCIKLVTKSYKTSYNLGVYLMINFLPFFAFSFQTMIHLKYYFLSSYWWRKQYNVL